MAPPVMCQLLGTTKFSVLSVETAEARSNATAAAATTTNESLETAAAVKLSTNPQAVSYSALSMDPLALRLADATYGAQWAFGLNPETGAHPAHDNDEALIVNTTTSHSAAETTTMDSTKRVLEDPVHTAPKAESQTLVDATVPTTTTTTEAVVTSAPTSATTTTTATMLVRDTLHGGFLVVEQSPVMSNPDAVHQPAAAPAAVTSQFATLPAATCTANLQNGHTEQRVLPIFSAQLPSKLPCNKADDWNRDELSVLFRATLPTWDTSVAEPAVLNSTTTAETLVPVTKTAAESSSPHQNGTPVQSTTRAAIPPTVSDVEESVAPAVVTTIQGKECSAPEPNRSRTEEALLHREVSAQRNVVTDSETIEPVGSARERIAPDLVETNVNETATMDTLAATTNLAAALCESAEPPTVSPLETVEPTAGGKAGERDFMTEPEPTEMEATGPENAPQPNVVKIAPIESISHANNEDQASAMPVDSEPSSCQLPVHSMTAVAHPDTVNNLLPAPVETVENKDRGAIIPEESVTREGAVVACEISGRANGRVEPEGSSVAGTPVPDNRLEAQTIETIPNYNDASPAVVNVEPAAVNALTAESNDEAGLENNEVGTIEPPSNEADLENGAHDLNAATQVIESMIANSFQSNELEVCTCVYLLLSSNRRLTSMIFRAL
jgi:hypothetical protein